MKKQKLKVGDVYDSKLTEKGMYYLVSLKNSTIKSKSKNFSKLMTHAGPTSNYVVKSKEKSGTLTMGWTYL